MTLETVLHDLNPWWREPAARAARNLPFRRHPHSLLLRRLRDPEERRAAVLLGPRQIGKTVLLGQLIDDLLDAGLPPARVAYFDFADDRLLTIPTARQVTEALSSGTAGAQTHYLFLDEITRATNWDLWLKQAVDRGGLRIVATDSAASLLRRGSQESGLGRWDEHRLEPFSFSELARFLTPAVETAAEAADLYPTLVERYLAIGGFPEHAVRSDLRVARERLRSGIVEKAIFRDLPRLGVDIEIHRAKALFVYLVEHSGETFNLNARASDLEASPKSVDRWVQLLEETALLISLPQRSGPKAFSRLRAKRRIYAADPGLVSALAERPVVEDTVRARTFEAAVFRHLREVARAHDHRLSYFRVDKSNRPLEVDFVIDLPTGPVGIEVTSSADPAGHLERTAAAAKALGATRTLLVHGGWAARRAGSHPTIELVGIRDFLLQPEMVLEGGGRG